MKRTIRTLVLTLTVAAVAAPAASAKTLVVDDDNGCADKQYSTIQAAVNAAAPGNTVAVCPGQYNEAVEIHTAKLKLISRVRHAAVITQPTQMNAVYTDGPGVLVRGFTIKGDPAQVACDQGVQVYNWATIDHNRITGFHCGNPPFEFQGDAVEIDTQQFGPGTTTVAKNEIDDFGRYGISERSANGLVRIQDNYIHDGGTGVNFECCTGKVLSNTIEGMTFAGISADAFDDNNFDLQIAGNRVRGNLHGILTGGIGVANDDPNNRYRLKVERNRVMDNAGVGLWHDGTHPAYFKENTSLGNDGADCADAADTGATWTRNIGVISTPSHLCRPPD